MSPGEFYSAVYSTAIGLGANDVQARLAAAQASEETGFGQSMVGGNLFGIKASSSYTGPSVTASTQEEYNGNTVRENANFRAYTSFEDSVRDYLGTIQSNFPDAWSAPSFSDAVAGLKTGVYGSYATRAAYPQHLAAIDKKYGALQYAQNPLNVPTPYGPNDFVDLAGLPNDVIPVADQNFINSDPALAFAQNLTGVPTPFSPDQLAPADTQGAIAAPVDNMPDHWGLNPDVAPVPYETFNQWEAMANAPPVQAPAQGLLSTPSQGLLSPDLQNLAEGMNAQRGIIPQQNMPTLNNFADLANAGPMGGDFAAPQDRFAGAQSSQSRPFDRYVDTTSYPANVDYGSYPPGSAPAFDTSAVAPNRVQTTSLAPGLLGVPADLTNFAEGMNAQRQVAPAPVTNGFSDMAAAGPMGGDYASPASRMGLLDPGIDQSRLDGLGLSVGTMDASRLYSDPKTSRIGQTPAIDAARMPGLLDPATNTQSFMDQLAAPANLGSFADAYAAQRGPTSGIYSADMSARMADVQRQLQDPSRLAPAVQPSYDVAATGLLAGNAPLSAQATVPSVPGQMSPAQIGAYQQMAASAPNITNLSGFTGIWDDGTAYQNAVPSAPAVAALDTVDVPDQPTVADVEVPGPASTDALDQQRQATTRPAVRSNAMVQNNHSLLNSVKNAINPGTLTGGLLGSLAGPIGTVAGGLLGNSAYQNGGFRGLLSQPSYDINPIGSGVQASYSVWGGGLPPGSQATATNGSQITAMPGGMTAVTNKFGATTVFDANGKAYGYHGTALSQDQDQDTESEGGLFSGW